MRPAARISCAIPVLIALCLVACAAVALFAHGRSVRAALHESDFAAFYCAATAVREGADPYRWRPLEACERDEVAAAIGSLYHERDFDPAPLPAYAIALLVPLSLLPYSWAALVWYALLLAAVVASAGVLATLTGLPRLAVAAALAGTGIVASLPYGQLAPLALLGLSFAALSLERKRYGWAAAGAVLALLQPQTGIAAVIASGLWIPRMRAPLAAAIGALAILSIAVGGIAGNLEYFRFVLPAQALAEAPFRIQLSATWLLYFFGTGEYAAVRIAAIEYAVVVTAGVLAAARVARALRSEAALVLFPAAAALAGGTYLHVFALAAGLPFAMLAASRRGRRRTAAWFALGILSVAWQALGSHAVLLLSALTAATIAWFAGAAEPVRVRAFACTAALAVVLAWPALTARLSDVAHHPSPTGGTLISGPEAPFAPARHGVLLRDEPESTDDSWRVFAEKMPFWVAILLTLVAGEGFAKGKSAATRRAARQS